MHCLDQAMYVLLAAGRDALPSDLPNAFRYFDLSPLYRFAQQRAGGDPSITVFTLQCDIGLTLHHS